MYRWSGTPTHPTCFDRAGSNIDVVPRHDQRLHSTCSTLTLHRLPFLSLSLLTLYPHTKHTLLTSAETDKMAAPMQVDEAVPGDSSQSACNWICKEPAKLTQCS